jgi:hypothetical protein
MKRASIKPGAVQEPAPRYRGADDLEEAIVGVDYLGSPRFPESPKNGHIGLVIVHLFGQRAREDVVPSAVRDDQECVSVE